MPSYSQYFDNRASKKQARVNELPRDEHEMAPEVSRAAMPNQKLPMMGKAPHPSEAMSGYKMMSRSGRKHNGPRY